MDIAWDVTPADLEAICREAALDAIRDTIRGGGTDAIPDDTPLHITRKHCENAVAVWAARTHIL